MSKIVKNTTASPINVADVGVTVPASPGQYTIPAQDYLLWAASSDAVTHIGSGGLLVNDGSTDLSISDGTDLIKGIFPKDGRIVGATDLTKIGNVGDRLKVDASVSFPSTSFIDVFSKKYRTDYLSSTVVLSGTYQTIFSYSGSGKFVGFAATYEASGTIYRLKIDGDVIFGDITGTEIAGVMVDKAALEAAGGGLVVSADAKRILFRAQRPILYTSSVLIEAKESTAKRHFSYMVTLTKET